MNIKPFHYLINIARAHWVTILVALLGIFSTYYYHQKSIEARTPILLEQHPRTSIISSENILNAPIAVIDRESGGEIKDSISVANFYFWNGGKRPIKRADLLTPLELCVSEGVGRVLSYRVVKMSRPVVGAQLQFHESREGRCLSLDMAILEEGDGFSFQVIFTGNPNGVFDLRGYIEGVKSVISNKSLEKKTFWKKYVTYQVISLAILAFFVIFAHFSPVEDADGKEVVQSKKPSRKSDLLVALLGGVVAISLLIALFVLIPLSAAHKASQAAIIDHVPTVLLK